MTTPALTICDDPSSLAVQAANFIIHSAQEAVAVRGRFLIALTGGSTPEPTYALLAQPALADQIDWARTYVFFGDERFVPPVDPRSNFGMARRSLLAGVPLPSTQLFPIPTDRPTAAECAVAYASILAQAFGQPADAGPPRFDLILLGLGDDGHVASLFPEAPSLQVDNVWVTSSPPGTLPPPVERITLTYPVLNAARKVLFLVAGENKAVPLRDILVGHAPRAVRPAAGVQPTDGTVTWLVDQAAARWLPH